MRKQIFVCGIALCLALSMVGCGKSPEERQAANYYQNELGLDKEEAESLAHEIYGEDEEEPGAVEEGPAETVVEPLPELVNSEWFDRKVQIYDMVFTNDYSMTEEDIRKIVDGSAYNIELTEGFDKNGEVCLENLKVDGKIIAQLWKWNYDSDSNAAKYGLPNVGDCYRIGYGRVYMENNWYDKIAIEFKNLKTRNDLLAYLSENGFIEVEKEHATYAEGSWVISSFFDDPVEYADTPHYYCNGVQSITFFRIHKLGETDQEMTGSYNLRYSGAHLNLVNSITVEFNTDGTIDLSTNNEIRDYSGLDASTWEVEIMGEQID